MAATRCGQRWPAGASAFATRRSWPSDASAPQPFVRARARFRVALNTGRQRLLIGAHWLSCGVSVLARRFRAYASSAGGSVCSRTGEADLDRSAQDPHTALPSAATNPRASTLAQCVPLSCGMTRSADVDGVARRAFQVRAHRSAVRGHLGLRATRLHAPVRNGPAHSFRGAPRPAADNRRRAASPMLLPISTAAPSAQPRAANGAATEYQGPRATTQ
jgi:hypothetical protein